jgi:hypothetical protein
MLFCFRGSPLQPLEPQSHLPLPPVLEAFRRDAAYVRRWRIPKGHCAPNTQLTSSLQSLKVP